jgi:hypothetical protein
MKLLSFQIGVETFTRCGGACEGCALTSAERLSGEVSFENLEKQIQEAKNFVANTLKEEEAEVEAITVFFGQGDHFLLEEAQLLALFEKMSQAWPLGWQSKTTFLMTASAVTKAEHLRLKAKAVNDLSKRLGLNWFVQVVFDPKKLTATPSFSSTYLENILFLKQLFSMVELTVNLAKDVADHMSPREFHAWVKEHEIKHVEFNWVMRKELAPLWEKDLDDVWQWLRELVLASQEEKVYEINFIPWMAKRLKDAGHVLLDERAIYITQEGVPLAAQVGPIGNVSPFRDRLETSMVNAHKEKIEVIKAFNRKACATCEYSKLCQINGVYPWKQTLPNHTDAGCTLGLKNWYDFLNPILKEKEGRTIFDKNPTPHQDIKGSPLKTAHYFKQGDVE